MSTTIDQRVVEMQFDNRHFERNVSDTMSTLDKLKQKLNLSGASKGLEDVNSAAKHVDMSGLAQGVETVRMRFSALQVMGVTALTNITNQAVNAGKRIVSALTIDPIKTGLSEYETQINAVQTILANTESKGTTLKDVNGALDELNTYADKTIYNFTEMTRNIGTFTAAGVDLDTSVNAIQGIANLAAVSGSSSQQASTAMYQLSQAMASGTVKLMDWNSVVNAGMGGQVFQDALKETARVHGVKIDEMIKKNGSFRETLQEEWLTTDILTETLSKFTMATEGLTKAEIEANREKLKNLGYTDEQIEGIFKLGNTATDAATKVKTFSQLWDTLKETAQSGWTQTWEILLGDFEESKEFFSNLYNTLAPMIDGMSKARNELLQGWKDEGGRQDVIASLYNVFQGIGNIIKPIKEAFREIFPPMTVKRLVGFTEGLKNLTTSFKKFFEEGSDNAKNLKMTFKGLFAALDIVKMAFGAVFDIIKPLFGGVGDLSGGILDLTASFGRWLIQLRNSVIQGGSFATVVDRVRDAFSKVGEFLKPVAEGIKEFGSSISTAFTDISAKAEERLGPLAVLGNFIKSIFVGIGNIIQKIAPYVSAAASGIGNVLSELMGTISSAIQNADYNSLFDFANGGIITAIGVFIAKFIKSGGDILDNAGGFLDNINGILEGVSDAFGAFTESMKADTIKKIATAIAILAGALLVLALIPSDKLTSALFAISVLFGELIGSLSMVNKIGDVRGIGKIAASLVVLSSALLILSVALKIMSTMSWEEMGVGLISMTVGLGALVGAVNLLPEKKVNGAAKAIKKMSTAVLILAVAIKIMSTMSWEEMGVGLTTMVVGLGALVGAVHLLPKDTALRAAGMVGLATAMVILGGALKIMATMSWDDIARSLVALAGSLGILAGAMALMKKAIPGAAAMMIVAPALVVLSGAMRIMGDLSWGEVARGLVTLAGSLFIIAGAMALMKTALPGAAALLVVVASLTVLAPVLMTLGSMSLSEIGKGLLALAGVFAVLGLAALVLKPLVPTIIALSGAITLLGIACAAIGAGALALGIGLTMIAVAGSAAAISLTTIVSSIISLIPYLIEQIGVGIIKLCEVIAGSGAAIFDAAKVLVIAFVDAIVASVPAIAEGALVLVKSLLQALADHTPAIVSALFDFLIGILDAIATKLPDLIQAGVNLLMAFFSGVVDALKSIDPGVLVNGLMAVGVLAALVAAMAAVAILTPAALVGVLGMGAVVTELAIVLAAIGALAQIPGLQWLVDEGAYFMQSIGSAIGNFIGSLIGGVAQGITSALPQIGTDLSIFMDNIQPFIEGAKQIDASMMDGVNALVGVILALTAANILEGLTSWITGGSSLTKFGEELASFAPNIKLYADTIAGIDASAVEASANAAKALSEMANTLPNSGGLAGLLAGENDLGTFAAQLVPFGVSLKTYSLAVAGIDAAAIVSSAAAARALADMASVIPNEGGVKAWFTGENSISKFGSDLISLGTGLKGFSMSIMGVVPESIIEAANAAKVLAEMTSTIPNEGGMKAWFTGENSISKFGNDLFSLGNGLRGFSMAILGIIPENMIAAANAAKVLAEMTATIPNEGGMKAWFTGENSISKFGDDLISLGNGLKGFSVAIMGVVPENIISAANAAKVLAEMTTTIPNEGGMKAWFVGDNSISKFGNDLISLGYGLLGFSGSVMGIVPENIVSAANAAKALADMASVVPNEGGVKAWFVGENSISAFADQLPGLGKGLKGFSDSVEGVNPENVTAAANAAKSIAEMATIIPNEGGVKAWFTGENSISTFAGHLPTLGKGLKGFSDSVEGINAQNVTGAANAAKSLAGMTETVPDTSGKLVDFGDNLETFADSLKSYITKTEGIGSGSVAGTVKAVNTIKAAAEIDSGKLKSIAKAIDSVVESLDGLAGITADTTKGFVSAMSDMGNASVKALLEAFDGLDEKLKKIGQEAIKAFSSGIKDKTSSATDACKTLVTKCADKIKGLASSFTSAGKAVVDGFASGISANTFKAEAKAKAMANAAEKAAKEALEVNSPSKVFIPLGKAIPEGLVKGMDLMGHVVSRSSEDMAHTAVNSTRGVLSSIADAINSDIDTQPTIRPVLDLSDVSSGAGALNGMFSDQLVGVSANASRLSSSMNLRQNGANNDVISAIKDLGRRLGTSTGNTYMINGLSYSEGDDVAEAFKTIVRAARQERRS